MIWTGMFDTVQQEVFSVIAIAFGVAMGIFALLSATRFGVKVIKMFFPNAYHPDYPDIK